MHSQKHVNMGQAKCLGVEPTGRFERQRRVRRVLINMGGAEPRQVPHLECLHGTDHHHGLRYPRPESAQQTARVVKATGGIPHGVAKHLKSAESERKEEVE